MVAAVDVSVVVPCFNAARYLEQAIRSVLEQQGPTLEVIVVDDGSSDDSVAVAERQGPKVRVLKQANRGPAAARNRGVREAQGRFIAFLDADDLWLPGTLQRRLQCFDEAPDLGLVYGGFDLWHPERHGAPAWQAESRRHVDLAAQAERSGWIYPEILLDSLICIITVVVRREVFDAVGGFDEQLRTGEDYDFWVRVAQRYRCRRLDETVAWYRLHEGGTTRVPRPECNEYGVVLRALERFGTSGQRGVPLPRRLLDQRLYRLCFDHGYLHYWHGQSAVAQRQFAQALRHSAAHPKAWAYWLLAGAKRLAGR